MKIRVAVIYVERTMIVVFDDDEDAELDPDNEMFLAHFSAQVPKHIT